MTSKRITAILGTFVMFAHIANNQAQKQGTGSEGIRTSVVVSRQRILPYEPLSVMVLLRNETREDKRVLATWCSFLSIGEKRVDSTQRRDYRGDNEPLPKPCVPSPKTLAPAETTNIRAHIDYEAPSGNHVFAHPGEYLLKGGTTDSNASFVSDEIRITVRQPQGIDAKAYEFLRTSDLHHFFGEYTIHKYEYTQTTVEDMEKFIAEFDGSEYSYLARMGLAFMWLRGVEGKQNQSKALELLTQVTEQAGDPLSSAAEYHLGKIQFSGETSMLEQKKKILQANYHFQRVLSESPSPYFRYLAEAALRPR